MVLQALSTAVFGLGSAWLTYWLFQDTLTTFTAHRAGYQQALRLGIWCMGWYSLVTLYALWSGVWSFPLIVVVAACSATCWSDTLFLLIHHVWGRWLAVAIALASALDYGLMPWPDALAGCVYGYGLLTIMRALFGRLHQKEVLGAGDPEFMALIGLATGLYGAWATLLGASTLGLLMAGLTYVRTGMAPERIPLGAYLGLVGSVCVVYYPTVSSMTWVITPS